MTEVSQSEVSLEFQGKTDRLSILLKEHNIVVPQLPLTDFTNVTSPREWLLRGETLKTRLTEPESYPFTHRGGERTTSGVFLGDCLDPLVYPLQGAMYVFKTEEIADSWLVDPSEKFQEEFYKVINEKKLNPYSISGGYEGEMELYHNFNVYQAKKGIATLCNDLAVDKVHAIVMTDKFLDRDERSHISSELKDKIIITPKF